MVDVILLTYNQEKYIEKTLKGILSQRCNYPFRVIVNDDVSTDGTRNILLSYKKKYPQIIDLQLNSQNLGIPNNFYDAMGRSDGENVALCAGDDMWIDEYKLQRQVDILENNATVGLVYTDYYICNEKDEIIDTKNVGEYKLESLLLTNSIAALTVCFRRKLYNHYRTDVNPQSKHWRMEDYPLWLWILSKSKGYYIPKPMCMYRIVPNSVSHNINIEKQLQYINSANSIRKFFNSRLSIYSSREMSNICSINILQLYINTKNYNEFKTESTKLNLLDFKSIIYWLVGKNRTIFNLFCSYVKK